MYVNSLQDFVDKTYAFYIDLTSDALMNGVKSSYYGVWPVIAGSNLVHVKSLLSGGAATRPFF